MMTYQENHYLEIFDEWQCARDYNIFCNDGILDESQWNKSSPQILFLLKESNAHFYNIRGQGWGPKGNSKVFWRNINIWSDVVSDVWNQKQPNIEKINFVKERKVEAIAYVNVKKNAQNKSTSNNNDIVDYAIRDKEFLVRQINCIAPEIIICCGTINSLKVLYDIKMVSPRIYSFNNKLVIDFYHPSCRNSYKTNFKDLDYILANQECLNEISRIKFQL